MVSRSRFGGAWPAEGRRVGQRALTDTSRSPNVAVHSLDMNAVKWNGGFWADRFDLAYRTIIPSMWKVVNMTDNGCSFVTFLIAAGAPLELNYATSYSDGDFYKWIESLAHIYAVTGDPDLDRRMDEVIAVISKAQSPDGYISTPLQIRNAKRFQNLLDHELYNMGHLMTAAVIHRRATGKDNFLTLARKTADYLYDTFSQRPPELAHVDFNPSQIMALVEMYRETRERKYLELAHIYIDNRGSQPGGSDQNQDRTPLREANEAVGHAVLAAYLYAGTSDYLAESGDPELRAAIDRLWNDVAARKVYITGAIGALHSGMSAPRRGDEVHEAFGMDFELPNRTAYNETCANIANAMWNWRMLSLTGEARYADMMERVFYNSMLSGISLKGTEYFYTNVLRRDTSLPLFWNDTAQRWPNTAERRAPGQKTAPAFCCPPNVLRTLASMHEYVYSISDEALWVHFYASNTLETTLEDGRALEITQETQFPWDGRVLLRVGNKAPGQLSINLRIPEWADGASLRVNGNLRPGTLTPGSYAQVASAWRAGDMIELDLPMRTRFVTGPPQSDEVRGQVAVMRGPIVYCVESHDLPHGWTIDNLAVKSDGILGSDHRAELLGGVTVIRMKGRRTPQRDPAGETYQRLENMPQDEIEFSMIPYYSWANRGVASMTVWLPLLG